MNHCDYYRFQAQARGVRSFDDVRRIATDRAYLYDRIVMPWLPAERSGPIAELACGHGSFLEWLKSLDFTDITGVDSSVEQVSLARQAGVTVELEDVNLWLGRQPAERYAALVAIDLVEHLPKDAFMDFLQAAQHALTADGCLILRLPNGDSPLVGMNLFNDITHVWTYTPNCLDSLAKMHGFAGTSFADEGADALRDHRWLKVPLAKLSGTILRGLFHAATRERVRYLSPNLWACLRKQ